MANTFSSRNTLKTKLLAAINAAGSADQIVKLSRSIEKANLDDDADLETALDTKVSALAGTASTEDIEKLAFGVKKLRTPEGAGVPTSTMIAEGSTNLYVTQDRVRGSFSASGDLSYDSGTGVLSYTALPDALTVYATVADLPSSGVAAGAKGIVEENKKLYIFTGASWVGVGLVDQKPSFTTTPDGSYSLSPGEDTVITLSATDPQGDPITFSHVVSAGSLGGSTVSQSGNVFTITGSSDTNDTAPFSITFRASDGTNITDATSEFTVQFGTDWSSLAKDTSYTFPIPSGANSTWFGISIDKDETVAIIADRLWDNPSDPAPEGGYVGRLTVYDISGTSPQFVDNINGYANGDTFTWSGGTLSSNLSYYGLHERAITINFQISENYFWSGDNKMINNTNTKYGGFMFHNRSDRAQAHFIIPQLGGNGHTSMTSFGTNGVDFVENHPIQGDVLFGSYTNTSPSAGIAGTDPNNPVTQVQVANRIRYTGNAEAGEIIKLSDPSNRVQIYNNEFAGKNGAEWAGKKGSVKISPTTNHIAIGVYEAAGGADWNSHSDAPNVSHGMVYFNENVFDNPSSGEFISREGKIGVYDMTTGALQYQVGPTSADYLSLAQRGHDQYGNLAYGARFGMHVHADSEGFITFGSFPTGNYSASGHVWKVVWQKFAWADGNLLWTTTVDTGAWPGYSGNSINEIKSDYYNGYIAIYTYCEPGQTQNGGPRTPYIRLLETSTGTIVKELDITGDHQYGIWDLSLNNNSITTKGYGSSINTYRI